MLTRAHIQASVPGAEQRPAADRSELARRIIIAVIVSGVSGLAARYTQALHTHATDFAQLWHAARGLLHGIDPYSVVGPGRTFDWPFPLLYPLTAVIVTVPFALLPLQAANLLFVALGTGALAWVITARRERAGHWSALCSWTYFEVSHTAQWSPLLMAAARTPPMAFLLACKPTLGVALFAGYPSRHALLGGAALALLSLLVDPSWPWRWVATLGAATHMSAPVMHVTYGGPLLLLALLRWRRPDARVLAAMACVPHTTLVYETLPLFLIVERWYEGAFLAIAGMVVAYIRLDRSDYDAWVWNTGNWLTLFMYLPCLIVVLRRPNAAPPCHAGRERIGPHSTSAPRHAHK